LSAKKNARRTVNRLRVGLVAGAMVVAGMLLIAPNSLEVWASFPILLMVLIEEMIGRSLFYVVLYERVL
jgi:hypothetical protein